MLFLTAALDPRDPQPLYRQVYAHIAAQIRSGALAQGTRLPGKRALASQLAVSVNTIDTAYQMLAAEGYLEARARSGFFVREIPAEFPPALPQPSPAAPLPPQAWRFDCLPGRVDTTLFPVHTWGRIQRGLLYDHPDLLEHGSRQGDQNLREAIVAYLTAWRGVRCTAAQVIIGAGVEYLLGLAARLLNGSVAAVEEPGYDRSRLILENNGIPCRCVPLDADGLRVDALAAADADLCYVTPSHHFPTGVTMPVGRRSQLLHWAAQGNRYILEDDYDAEFRFDTRPLPSLQGMAGPDGPVIYLCTFSKSLAPGIRIACMVLPTVLLDKYRAMFGEYSCTVSRTEQQTLALFMAEGHFTRHLNRMRQRYHRKLILLCDALEAAFGPGRLRLQGLHTGLHLMLTLPCGPGETEMVRRAAQAGIRLSPLSAYCRRPETPRSENTVILGYAALDEADLPALAAALRRTWLADSESAPRLSSLPRK